MSAESKHERGLDAKCAEAMSEQAGRHVRALQEFGVGEPEPFQAAAKGLRLSRSGRFVRHSAQFALWSGLLFASGIGAVVWAIGVPDRNAPAAETAAAYSLIAVSSFFGVRAEGQRFVDQLRRLPSSGSDRGKAFVASYTAVFLLAAFVYGGLVGVRLHRAASTHLLLFSLGDEFGAFLLVAAFGVAIAYVICALAYADAVGPRTARETMFWPLQLFASRRTPPPSRESMRLDSAMISLLEAATRTAGIPGRRETVSIIGLLERSAAEAERYALARVPFLDPATRSLAHKEGAKLAGLIRATKLPLACAIHRADYDDAAAAMARVLRAWSEQTGKDLATLVDAAPTLERRPLWRRVGGQVWNAVLLAGAGIALPLLPAYSHEQAAAQGVRYSLLTAAVFALATGKVTAWDSVSSGLARLSGAPDGP
jgi:hypothetical protein